MTDDWWQVLKSRYDNMKPVSGNLPCPTCQGVGTITGNIGYGGFISPQYTRYNKEHPLIAGRKRNLDQEVEDVVNESGEE